MATENKNWILFAILGAFALWAVAKLRGGSTPFTGITSQRGIFGKDQFPGSIDPVTGNPIGGS